MGINDTSGDRRCGSFSVALQHLRFFYFTFICQLQRVVNLTARMSKPWRKSFISGLSGDLSRASAALLFAHPALRRAFWLTVFDLRRVIRFFDHF